MPTLFPELWCEKEIRDENDVVLDFWSQSRNLYPCHWSPSLITPRKISLCHLSPSVSCDLSCSLPGFKQKKMVTNYKDPTLKFFEPKIVKILFWRKSKHFNCTETNNSIWSMVQKLLFNHTNDGMKGMAAHFSILAWRIPWTEEPGGLQSMGSWRVRHDWRTNTLTFIQMLYCALGLLGKSWAIWIWTSQMIQVEGADGFFSSAKVEWSAAVATVQSAPGNTFAGSPLPRGGDTVYYHRSYLCTDSLAQWFSSCACVGLRWGQEVSCISLRLTPLQAAATAGTTLWEPLLQPERWSSWV